MSRPFFPSRHLDSPVLVPALRRATQCIRILMKLPSCFEDQALFREQLPLGLSEFEVRSTCSTYGVLVISCKVLRVVPSDLNPLDPAWYPLLLRGVSIGTTSTGRIWNYVSSALDPVIQSLDHGITTLTQARSALRDGMRIPESVIRATAQEEAFAWHVEKYVAYRSEGGTDPFISKHRCMSLVISQAICILKVHADNWRLDDPFPSIVYLSYDQLLLLRDSLMMRKNTYLAAHLCYPGDLLLPDLMDRSFAWQEQCLTEMSNAGYEVVKAVEGLAKTWMSRLAGDPLSGPGDDFDLMKDKVGKKELEIRQSQYIPRQRQETLADLYETNVLFHATELYQVVELFGLQKMTGHPLIDPYTSSEKSKRIAQEVESVLPSAATDLVNTFKRLFTEGFIRRHQRWPRLRFTAVNTRLEELYHAQILSLGKQSYSHSDWSFVHFSKEFDFEYYENYLDLLDDKAISFYLSEKHLQWDTGIPSSSRRLLLEILNREDFSVRDIVNTVESGNIPAEWLICSLYPKEREFKLAARMFVMLVAEMRTFFAVHEANIADQILPYLPQITMVDDKLTVHRRFLDLTRPMEDSSRVKVFLELDLSSWNLRWRKVTIDPIGHCLNELFGLSRTFSSAHDFFSASCIMVRVGGCRPDSAEATYPPESELCWYNHNGGFEGIVQKLWSIATVCMIERAFKDLPYQYSLTDQGDNVFVTLITDRDYSMTLEDQARNIRNDGLTAASCAAAEVNQDLRPDESLASMTVGTYSKVVYINGVDYSTTLKSLSRAVPSSAIDFPSFSSYVQAIFSGAYTAAEGHKRPMTCYTFALLQFGYYVARLQDFPGPYARAIKATKLLQSPRGIRTMAICPPELGGLPIIGPYAFLYKGGGDPLSKALASLKLFQSTLVEARHIIGASRADEWYNPSPTLRALLQDPYGLPVIKAISPDEAVAEESLAVVKAIARNKDFRDVLFFSGDEYEKALTDIVATMTPFNPVVARDLLDCSALGSVATIKRMFLKTRTLQTIARTYEDNDLVTTLLDAGHKEIHSVSLLLTHVVYYSGIIMGLYEYVEGLRARWEPAGIKICSLTSYLPIDFKLTWDPSPTEVGIFADMRAGSSDVFYSRGPCYPYLGTRTIEKRAEHGYKIHGTGYAASSLKSLQSILSWAAMDPGMTTLVDYLSRSRCGLSLSAYSSILASVVGGDQGHRYSARIGERDASIMGITGPATYVCLDSDHAGFLSATTEDYPIMFQEYFLYLTSLLAIRWDNGGHEGFLQVLLIIGDSPLSVLPLEKLTVEVVALPDEVPQTMRLVQGTGISVTRTGGPNWLAELPLHTAPSESLLFPAIVAEIQRAVGARRRVMGILSSAVLPISTRFGVQEVVGMGGHLLLDACAIVLLESTLGLIRSHRHAHQFNASINFLVQRFGGIMVDGIIPFLNHPAMENDELVRMLNLGPEPQYRGPLSERSKLIGYLSRRTADLYCDPKSAYYTMPTVVFGSEEGEATLNGVIRLLRRKVMQAYVGGIINELDAEFIIGSPIRRLSRSGCSSETLKISEFLAILKTYASYPRGKVYVSAVASDILERIAVSADANQIYATTRDANEIIRVFRGALRTTHSPLPLDPEVLPLIESELGQQIPPPLSMGDTWKEQLVLYQFSSRVGRNNMLASGAGEAWMPLQGLFVGRDVLIVGSGLGACAAAAGLGGARNVFGHDLRQDFPRDVRHSHYKPPLVRYYCPKLHYKQTLLTISSSGDWFDASISHELLEFFESPFVLVIDLSSGKGSKIEALHPVLNHGFRGLVVFRSTAEDRDHAIILGVLARTCSNLKVFLADASHGYSEMVYCFSLPGRVDTRGRGPLWFSSFTKLPVHVSPDTSFLIISSLLAPLGGCQGTSVRVSSELALEIFKGMFGKGTLKADYEDWTEVLHSAVAAEWLTHFSRDEWEDQLLLMARTGVYRMRTHPMLLVKGENKLVWVLTHLAARVLLRLDNVL